MTDRHDPDAHIGRRNAPRNRVRIRASLRTGSGRAKEVWVTDLSKTGCRLHDRFGTMQRGKIVSLRFGEIGPVVGTVRWWENHTNGIEFEQPLHDVIVEQIVERFAETENILERRRSDR